MCLGGGLFLENKQLQLAELRKMVDAVIQSSQCYPFSFNTLDWIEQWHRAKSWFLDLFGEPIVRVARNITLPLREDELQKTYDQFLSEIKDIGCTQSLYAFIDNNASGFFDNRVIQDDKRFKQIHKGMKLSKCFKYFITNKTHLRELQDLASQYMQKTKVKGDLYLSIHPIDFLTISENASGWRSCHSLDGDYRAGNVNLMVDNTTFIAYLASSKPKHLKCLPEGMEWNDKKWRMLVHSNALKSIIYYDKQYPFKCDELMNKVHQYLQQKTPTCFYHPTTIGFRNALYQDTGEVDLGRNMIFTDGVIMTSDELIDVSRNNGYCDLVYSPNYSPVAALAMNTTFNALKLHTLTSKQRRLRRWFKDCYKIRVGDDAICCACHENIIQSEDKFICNDCITKYDCCSTEFFFVCEVCGRRIYDGEETYEIDGDTACYHCAHKILGEAKK